MEQTLYAFIAGELKELGCPVRIINGMPDHIHCLFLLNPQKSIADVIKQIKGSSSHYINQSDITRAKFSWQTGYAAYAVSASAVEKVHQYIHRQKQHHARKSFHQEYEAFIKIWELNR